jgi:hypothetical protein
VQQLPLLLLPAGGHHAGVSPPASGSRRRSRPRGRAAGCRRHRPGHSKAAPTCGQANSSTLPNWSPASSRPRARQASTAVALQRGGQRAAASSCGGAPPPCRRQQRSSTSAPASALQVEAESPLLRAAAAQGRGVGWGGGGAGGRGGVGAWGRGGGGAGGRGGVKAVMQVGGGSSRLGGPRRHLPQEADQGVPQGCRVQGGAGRMVQGAGRRAPGAGRQAAGSAPPRAPGPWPPTSTRTRS